MPESGSTFDMLSLFLRMRKADMIVESFQSISAGLYLVAWLMH